MIKILQEQTEAGVTDIASELGRSKGTVHSHPTTLVKYEYIVQQGDTYRLSLKFIDLGHSVKEELMRRKKLMKFAMLRLRFLKMGIYSAQSVHPVHPHVCVVISTDKNSQNWSHGQRMSLKSIPNLFNITLFIL